MDNLFEQLLAVYKSHEFIAELDTDDDGTQTLSLFPDFLGSDESGKVVIEISKVPFEDDFCYYQIFTTIAKGLDPLLMEKTLVKLNKMNIKVILGSYGILDDYNLLYHKYVANVPKDDTGFDMKAYFIDTINSVLTIVDSDYDTLLASLV